MSTPRPTHRSHIRTGLVAIVLAVAATACGSDTPDETADTAPAPTVEPAVTEPVADQQADADATLATVQEDLAAAEAALAAAEADLADAHEAVSAAEAQAADNRQELADYLDEVIETQRERDDAVESLREAERANATLAATNDELLADLRDAEYTARDLEESEDVVSLLQAEAIELRIALDELLDLAASLDDTEYPDCNPVHQQDRSLFGLPTGADMDEVIAVVTERCGPADPFVPTYDSWDYTPDRDQWNAMCVADDTWTRRTWRNADRVITVNFYRGMDDGGNPIDAGWMFGWTGGDLPAGIEIGMTRDQVTDILGLDPDRFVHEDLSDYGIDMPDHTYYWGEGDGWGPTASTHGQPYNSSVLYFDEGLFVGFASTDYNMCQ